VRLRKARPAFWSTPTQRPIALVGDTANGGLEVVQSIPSKPNG
jgi:hypothetical protein